METNVQVFRGFFDSKVKIQNVSQQEQLLIKPILVKLSLLVGISVLLSAILGIVGYQSEEISKQVGQQSLEYIEALQFYHIVGIALKGLLTPVFYLFFSVLLTYYLLKEIRVGVLVHIHLLFIWLILLNQMVELVLFYFWGIPAISSPISLGIVAQILLDHPLFIHILTEVNLIYIGGLVYLTILLQSVSTKQRVEIGLIVFLVHFILALAGAGISVINIEEWMN
ncbi:hypothetical protein JOC85_000767 [Bacillus mesophilus]|uniref:Yip1 domain-containing protein n=1 Tax=Bacillus mesophilus TaxID=1808955 RepID=A0A6M0Q3A8_9BACI|nr:hypothetical protein [Bacillus mesophilus]MBM7660000.1 hypothetical protein [Bacillus mesophilus]NEY70861.1 hypothetical protein [Bacillus mesophilus]